MADTQIQLKNVCDELKVEPREARARLRWAVKDPKNFPELAKAYKPRQPWQWTKGSPTHKEAIKAINTTIAQS
ncbi:MAG: hypothetical protein RIM72_16050 [Alphaproteobacteria bacterium]